MRELYIGRVYQSESPNLCFSILDTTSSPVTGLTFNDISLCKYFRTGDSVLQTYTVDGSNFSELGEGLYKLSLTSTVTAFSGNLSLFVKGPSFNDIVLHCKIEPKNPGNTQITLTIEDQSSNKLPNTQVDIWDSGQTTLLWSGITNNSGQVVSALNPGSYKVVLRRHRTSFTVPESLTVTGPGPETKTYTGTVILPSVPVAPNTCVVYGSVFDIDGAADDGTSPDSIVVTINRVRGQLIVGDNFITQDYLRVKPDTNGYFEIELIQGIQVTIGIERVGIRKTVTIPAQASAALKDLV